MRRALIGLCVVVLVGLSGRALAAPSESLALARLEFDRGNWKRVISALQPMLYPRAQFREGEELKSAYYLLGSAYIYEKQQDRARHEFSALLALDPEYALDRDTESPEVYAFFEGLKGDLKDQLDILRRQKQRDEEARRQPSREILVETTVYPPGSPLSNFVPFGYPQFRNGDRGLGTFLMTTQVISGGTSLALFAYQAFTYGIPSRYGPDTDAGTLRALQIVQVSTGAAFLVAYGYSVIDGFRNNKPRTETKRSERLIPRPTSRLEILPFVPSSDGVGAQAVWRF